MDSFEGFRPRADLQNFTMVPNEFFDKVMAAVDSMAELKIVLAVFRKTYGWIDHIENGVPVYKIADNISYSQFKELTGLSDSAISDGIKKAIEHGLVVKLSTGTYQGEASRYRLTQKGDEIQPPPPEPPKEHKPSALLSVLKAEDVTPDVDAKEQTLAELLSGGVASVTEEKDTKPPKAGKKSFKEKPVQTWNCNDLLAYFSDRYRTFLGIPYGLVSGKDRKQAKELLDKSDIETLSLVKAIDYYLKNYQNIDGLPKGFPSWAVFFGWRNSIIPLALVGQEKMATGKKNMSVREYQQPPTQAWVADDWEAEPK